MYNVIHGNAAGCMRSLDVYYLCVCVYIAGVYNVIHGNAAGCI